MKKKPMSGKRKFVLGYLALLLLVYGFLGVMLVYAALIISALSFGTSRPEGAILLILIAGLSMLTFHALSSWTIFKRKKGPHYGIQTLLGVDILIFGFVAIGPLLGPYDPRVYIINYLPFAILAVCAGISMNFLQKLDKEK